MINLALVKRGMYFDSITLMKLARALNDMDEVMEAAALMATPANLQTLKETGLTPFAGLAEEPGSGDVLIVVQASDEAHARAALEAAETQLLHATQVATENGEESRTMQPRSLEEARRGQAQAAVAVISVPGMYAALEAQEALRAGLHVFLFSDNVSLEDEVALKRLGQERGLLVMGPDCGTALWQGAGLGFVNVVPDGPVGIVGASGTGMQQVMSLLAEAGHGISQAIGCGGRDLSAEVGGVTTLQGLRLLQTDEQTKVIVLISKTPAPEVAEKVLAAAANGLKPVVVIFIGADYAGWQERYAGSIFFASTLTEAAQLAGALCTAGQIISSSPEISQPNASLTLNAG
jgi:FdrA protein